MDSLETFALKDEFDKKMKDLRDLLQWDFDPISYDELKKNPDKYCLFEMKNHLKFILKESDDFFQTFRIFTAYITPENEISIDNIIVCPQDLEFMNSHS